MRAYIISIIRDSKKWQDCIDNGMEEELVLLEHMSDRDLLEAYDWYVMS